MACKNKIIAIDGPAGSGKSTVAKRIAEKLDLLYIDTGAMYRVLTLKAIKAKVDFENHAALAELAKGANIELKMDGTSLKVMLDGEDVTVAIRTKELTKKVGLVAKIADVRKEMVKLQRKLGDASGGAVLEGRDIGTVVFPDTKYKFYLDAKSQERAKRRHNQLQQMGQEVDLKVLSEDINKRDKSDITRDAGPLIKAHDAIYIDTTNLTIEEVVGKISKKCSI